MAQPLAKKQNEMCGMTAECTCCWGWGFVLMMCILLFCLLKDGDIDFILAPAVGSLTTATTGTGQGPSTSTIPGENSVVLYA